VSDVLALVEKLFRSVQFVDDLLGSVDLAFQGLFLAKSGRMRTLTLRRLFSGGHLSPSGCDPGP
jgi:hypothetical protein